MQEHIVSPTVIIPNRVFLVGALYGFNAGRKAVEKAPKDYFNGHEVDGKDFYLGSWFEVECSKCGRHYTFDNPNEIPEENLICETDSCNNHVILYGILEPDKWRVGNIKFS